MIAFRRGSSSLRDLDVLVERHGRAVPHVRLEDRVAAVGDDLLGLGDERQHEVLERRLRAVVGVQRDRDRVALGDLVHELREREGAGRASLDGVAGEVVRAARRDLDDAVGAGLGQALQDRVDALRAGGVERGIGEAAGLRAVQHLGVLLGGGDGHEQLLGRVQGSTVTLAKGALRGRDAATAAGAEGRRPCRRQESRFLRVAVGRNPRSPREPAG